MTPDRRSRRAVALPAGPVPTADQSPSQGNKGIISPNRHDSSNCLPVSTHPDVRRVFNEPPKKKKPRGPRHETPAKSVFAGSDRTFPRLTALRLYDYLLSRGDTRGPRQSCSIRPFFAVALENSSQSARGTFSVSPHWTAVSRGLVRDSVHVPRRSTRTARFRRGLVRVPKRACARGVAHNSARSAGRERARAPPSR